MNAKPAESSVNIQSLLGIVSRRKWFLIVPIVLAAPLVTLCAPRHAATARLSAFPYHSRAGVMHRLFLRRP